MGPRSLADLKRKDLFQQRGFINDEWVDASDGKTFDVIDPGTLEKIAQLPEMGAPEVEKAAAAAEAAFESYRKTSARQRARWLRKWNDLVLEHTEDLALIMTLENGKPLGESRGEVAYGASFLEWFVGEAERTHGEVIPTANLNQRIITVKQPLGVAACLTPWNFPIAMITRKAGAALAAGCTTVWKPAGETPLSALALAVLAKEAGFPNGSINVVLTLDKVSEVGEAICKSERIQKLSFTGSTRVGKILASLCGQHGLKKLSLELGGNSPFVVFDDAKIDTAVEACIMAKFRNSGQTCVTANRIFVQDGIYDRFIHALAEKIKTLKVGLGTDDGVFIGPMTHDRAVEKALAHIEDAKKHGASVVMGGSSFQPNDHKGYFLQPTILTNMSSEALTTREEVFAPVVALYRFKTEDEGVRLANDTKVGLGSFIMTENMPRMWRVAENIQAGMVGVNIGLLSAAENPFGGEFFRKSCFIGADNVVPGVKESGYGREGGRQGIEEYLTVKSIFLNVAG